MQRKCQISRKLLRDCRDKCNINEDVGGTDLFNRRYTRSLFDRARRFIVFDFRLRFVGGFVSLLKIPDTRAQPNEIVYHLYKYARDYVTLGRNAECLVLRE